LSDRVAANDYCFVTRWRVDATPTEVFDVLDHPLDYVRWWPSVWLRAELVEPGSPAGIGRRVRFLSRGRLPYTLQWTAETIAVDAPTHIAVRATGDFDGAGEWRLAPVGATRTEAEYRWTITATKPLLKRLSPILRPLFEWNHRWAMARGEECLRAELRRRRTPRSIR
jgi:hypothetical protein